MTKLEQFKTAKEVYLNLVNNHFDEVVKELLTEIKSEHPNLEAFVIAGYTPGWNDGEACYHSSQIEVNYVYEYESYLPEKEDGDYNSNLPNDEGTKIELKLNILDDLLEEKEGTDYIFVAIFKDETVEFKIEAYDVGY